MTLLPLSVLRQQFDADGSAFVRVEIIKAFALADTSNASAGDIEAVVTTAIDDPSAEIVHQPGAFSKHHC